MAKYVRTEIVDAVQWFKNGDHPEDRLWMVVPVPGDGVPFPSEGKVVRYYRHPRFPGDTICEGCGKIMHVHGWIDSGGEGQVVCPGDYVVTGPDGLRRPWKPADFVTTFTSFVPTP
jgi:hypothetical protein